MTQNYQVRLDSAGIRPSVQRVAVYAYLCEHPEHPTVDMVYSALAPDYPTLSKTTVYNTLKLFVEKNLIQTVQIEEDKLRYDADTSLHMHFKCMKCGKIFDLFGNSRLTQFNDDCNAILPEGFTAEKIQTNLWGICRDCSKK